MGLTPADVLDAVEVRQHPDWREGQDDATFDVAVLLLEAPPDATPRSLNRTDLAGRVGLPCGWSDTGVPTSAKSSSGLGWL